MQVRVQCFCIDVEAELVKEKKMAKYLSIVGKYISIFVRFLCLGFSAEGRQRAGTAPTSTASAQPTTAGTAVDTCLGVERNAGWIP